MKLHSIALLACVTGLSGCASIVNGVNQPLSVETRSQGAPMAGAACKLSSNKGTWFVTTPGTVTVHRGFQDLAVECFKDGGSPSTVAIESRVKFMFFGNILFGGLIGMAVDTGNGAAFDYPDLISVDMDSKPVDASLPPRPSSASTAVAYAVPASVVAIEKAPAAATEQAAWPVPQPMSKVARIAKASGPRERRYQFAAETFAKARSCAALPVAAFTTSGPGSETYTIPCATGEALIARCEFGHCRALQ